VTPKQAWPQASHQLNPALSIIEYTGVQNVLPLITNYIVYHDSDVIKTFFETTIKTNLNFKTKTKTLKFFQDQDQA